MKVALTVWGNRISPVFESARTLLLAEIDGFRIMDKTHVSCDCQDPRFLDTLKTMNIDILICGAISDLSMRIIAASSIKLIPFVTGNALQVLDFYMNETPVPPAYFMPGCNPVRHHKRLEPVAFNLDKP